MISMILFIATNINEVKMTNQETLDKLEELILEASMLTRVMHDALKAHEEKDGITDVSYLSEIICRKFKKISDLF